MTRSFRSFMLGAVAALGFVAAPASGGQPVLKLNNVSFNGDAYTAVFAVGSLAGGTLTVLPVEVTP